MQLCDLTLQYDGVRVLEHLNLTLPDSGLVCIFAPSGTGKTTLLNLFCGLLKPDSGRIEGLEDRKFAYVFQEDRLVPQLTARENIRLVIPSGNICHLRLCRCPAFDAVCIQHRIAVLIILTGCILSFLYSRHMLVIPGQCNFLNIMYALMPILYAIFDQILDQIR